MITTTAAVALAGPARAADAYAAALANAWGAPVDAKAAYTRAWRAARRLQVRADALLRRRGLARGTVAERLRRLAAEHRHLYSDDDAGRERAVTDMNASLAKLRPRLARAFGDMAMPMADVRRMSREDEAKGRGGYRDPPAYYVDLRAIRERPSWTLPSVAFHETNPGHVLQASMQSADPAKQQWSGVFSEAWATYAEQLAGDLGVYSDDPLAEIGALHWRLFRLARVVVDTGQGALGWSHAQGVEVMRELQGRDIAFVTIEADVERMRRQPGVFAAHGLGAMEIARLRPANPARWPAFHRAILADGPWPCAMLAALAKGGAR